MNCEVVSTITDYYAKDGEEGKELIKDILFYLYHTTTDHKLMANIVEWFNEENYCIQCGSKLTYYEWKEARPIGEEIMSAYDCSRCNDEH